MGVEVKQTLEREFGLAMEASAVRLLTFKRLAEIEAGDGAEGAPKAEEKGQEKGGEKTEQAETTADSALPQNALFGEKHGNRASVQVTH